MILHLLHWQAGRITPVSYTHLDVYKRQREVYACDDSESGKRRLLSMDEELEKLNKGFDELIKWDKMVAKSQKQNAENKQKFQNTKLDESFDAFDINQACDYILSLIHILQSQLSHRPLLAGLYWQERTWHRLVMEYPILSLLEL